jgi:hypothetical protein
MKSSLNLTTFKPPQQIPIKASMSKLSRDIREIVNTDAMGKQDSTVGLRYKKYLESNKTRTSSDLKSLPKKSDLVKGLH